MANRQISVRLHRYRDGRPIGLIWKLGGRDGEVTSGTTSEREAWKAAGRLEEQLEKGIVPGQKSINATTWKDFRGRYESQWLYNMSKGSNSGWTTAANHFERICKPKYLLDVDSAMLGDFRIGLEKEELSAASIRSYYRALHAGLGWAVEARLIPQAPTLRLRKLGRSNRSMRERVITLEEFERIVKVMCTHRSTPRTKDAREIKRFMQGLWYSGLRINELRSMRWEPTAGIHVRLDAELPLIVFLGEQKNRNDEYLPAPPEFWKLVGRPRKRGWVFNVPSRYGSQMTTANLGDIISDAGKSARVMVGESKHATAHDFRAAYLTRIADQTSLGVAQALGRHSDSKTTKKYYVRHEAEKLAEAVGWNQQS